ncbi:cupin domain-containing protein [Amaricoccus sp.]|uniref:cupin domain-containing protein n=1 Tax=Amaricoccus sp. TaxID=1872485 RepID=UPI002620C10A|nr:cupin domain-containing protein [Amaricoccus sp.]HRO12528.1 cupin domain-containing protein [Amaricoccus sp.]
MPGKFVIRSEVPADALDWGQLRWLCNPPSTGAAALTVIDVTLKPGKGHDFHKHPDQEEVIVVVSGRVEQWLDREQRLLGPGDSVFIPAGMVHASFNAGDGEARLAAILGPCVGEVGYVSVEVAGDAPWNTLRAR